MTFEISCFSFFWPFVAWTTLVSKGGQNYFLWSLSLFVPFVAIFSSFFLMVFVALDSVSVGEPFKGLTKVVVVIVEKALGWLFFNWSSWTSFRSFNGRLPVLQHWFRSWLFRILVFALTFDDFLPKLSQANSFWPFLLVYNLINSSRFLHKYRPKRASDRVQSASNSIKID